MTHILPRLFLSLLPRVLLAPIWRISTPGWSRRRSSDLSRAGDAPADMPLFLTPKRLHKCPARSDLPGGVS